MNKKHWIILAVILIGITSIGLVLADKDNSAKKTNEIESALGGGGFALLSDGSCNDVNIVYTATAVPGIYNINGYEYGCGYSDRIIDGTMRLDGQTLYIAYVVNVGTESVPTPYLGQYNIALDLSTLSGTGVWAYHYDSYHSGSDTYSIGPWASMMVEADGPDAAVQ